MPTPTRPATGAIIASDWGQEVHDQCFAPSGGRWHSQSAALTGTADIAWVADNDPGAWLAAPGGTNLVVPADGGGLYALAAQCKPTTGQASTLWRWLVKLNGAQVGGGSGYTDSSVTDVYFPAAATVLLAAGDIITAALVGPPSTGRLSIPSLTLTRLGRTWGIA